MLSAQVFLTSLQEAYKNADLNAILSHFELPLVLIKDEKTAFIKTKEAKRQHFSGMISDHKAAGIIQFDARVVTETGLGNSLTILRYQLIAQYKNGQQQPPTFGVFVLRETDGCLRATASIATRSGWRQKAGLPQRYPDT